MSREKKAAIPDLVLERYRLRELPADESAGLEELLRTDETLRRRLDALEASDQEIRRGYPPEWLAERIRERLRAAPALAPRPRPAWWRRWPVPATLAAAALLLVLNPPTLAPPPQGHGVIPSAPPALSDRIKGVAPSLTLYRRTADGSETLADGAVAHQGDRIRIGYRAAGHAYGAIVSVDGRGSVSVHLATRESRSVPLRSGETVLLEEAFELDDAPLWERFYFVVAEQPFALPPIVEAARRAAQPRGSAPAPQLSLPSPYTQFVVTLKKEVRP